MSDDVCVPTIGFVSVPPLARTMFPVPVVPSDRFDAASCATVNTPPEDVCITTLLAPPVADKSAPVPPFASVSIPVTFVPLRVTALAVRTPPDNVR